MNIEQHINEMILKFRVSNFWVKMWCLTQ